MIQSRRKEIALSESQGQRYDLNKTKCPNTGKNANVCNCLDCFPYTIPLTWPRKEAVTIDDAIHGLEGLVSHLMKLKAEGWTAGGSICEEYIELCPPNKEGYYWTRCMECGEPFTVEIGTESPCLCDKCDRRVYR